METSFCSFLIHVIILLRGAAHVIAVDESSAHVMCIDESGRPTTSILCPLSLPCKEVQAVSPSYAQSKAKKTSQENFMAIGGCFERYTFRVMALGWLKKERKKERKMKNSDFSTVSGLPL